jgi:hypothetical protein
MTNNWKGVNMKWPTYLALVRHDVSAYNQLKCTKKEQKDYQKFIELFEKDCESPETRALAKKCGTSIN